MKNDKSEVSLKNIRIRTCSSRCVHIGHGIVSGRGLRMMVGGSIVVRRSRSRRIGVGGPVVASRDHVCVVRVMLRHLAGAVVFI